MRRGRSGCRDRGLIDCHCPHTESPSRLRTGSDCCVNRCWRARESWLEAGGAGKRRDVEATLRADEPGEPVGRGCGGSSGQGAAAGRHQRGYHRRSAVPRGSLLARSSLGEAPSGSLLSTLCARGRLPCGVALHTAGGTNFLLRQLQASCAFPWQNPWAQARLVWAFMASCPLCQWSATSWFQFPAALLPKAPLLPAWGALLTASGGIQREIALYNIEYRRV